MTYDPRDFRSWLALQCDAHNVTRHDVARFCGVKIERVYSWCSGVQPMRVKCTLLAQAFGVAPRHVIKLVGRPVRYDEDGDVSVPQIVSHRLERSRAYWKGGGDSRRVFKLMCQVWEAENGQKGSW